MAKKKKSLNPEFAKALGIEPEKLTEQHLIDRLGDRWRKNPNGTYTNLKTFEYKDPATRNHNVVNGSDQSHEGVSSDFGVTRNLEEAFALEINRPAEEPVTEEL